jgi:hypothetical protein
VVIEGVILAFFCATNNWYQLLIPITSAIDLLDAHQEIGIPFDKFWMFQVLSERPIFSKWRGEVVAMVLAVCGGRSLAHIKCLTGKARPVRMPHKSKVLASGIQAFADAGYVIKCSNM